MRKFKIPALRQRNESVAPLEFSLLLMIVILVSGIALAKTTVPGFVRLESDNRAESRQDCGARKDRSADRRAAYPEHPSRQRRWCLTNGHTDIRFLTHKGARFR